jgi:hypothetical protein
MACCGIGNGCGRKDLDEPGPGLELWNGKYSCTLCFVNPTRYKQPIFKKHHIMESKPIASAPEIKPKATDLLGEIDD